MHVRRASGWVPMLATHATDLARATSRPTGGDGDGPLADGRTPRVALVVFGCLCYPLSERPRFFFQLLFPVVEHSARGCGDLPPASELWRGALSLWHVFRNGTVSGFLHYCDPVSHFALQSPGITCCPFVWEGAC